MVICTKIQPSFKKRDVSIIGSKPFILLETIPTGLKSITLEIFKKKKFLYLQKNYSRRNF